MTTPTATLAFDFSINGSSIVAKITIVDPADAADWSHRADLANWQDDFAADFEEVN
jgi:hypothetical protein